jgi:hypothetical protein
VHFKWKDKEIQLSAKSLDLTHPYFVSIKDLVFPTGKKIIINPSEDDIRKTFGESDHLMIPFQSVVLIEELKDEEGKGKVMPFGIVEDKARAGADKIDSSPKTEDESSEDTEASEAGPKES